MKPPDLGGFFMYFYENQFTMKIFLVCLTALLILSCETKQTPKHITATIVKNDVFEGNAISDPDYIHIEQALKLLFKDAPLKGNIADSIAAIIDNNKLFEAETNAISLIFKDGIIKDSIEVTVERTLSLSHKSDFMVIAPDNATYQFVTNTKNGCTIKPDKITPSKTALNIHYPLDNTYTLDTVSNNFYDDEHNILENFKGYKTRIYPGIYKVSYTIYNGKNPKSTKKLTYNTREHTVPYYLLVPNCKRTVL